MEEEIDLRQYIRVLIRHWYWIAGVALAAAVVAFAVSSFLPPTYEASALVAVTEPAYQVQLDTRLRDVPFDPKLLSKSYPTIATSDDLLLAVADAAGDLLPAGQVGLNGIKDMLGAKTAGDPYLIELTVRSEDPQLAANLVNVWAEQYVDYLNSLYGEGDSLSMFEAQLADTKTEMEQADQALADFRSEYGFGFSAVRDLGSTSEDSGAVGIARQLETKTRLLAEYETRADQITHLLQEAREVAARIDSKTSPAILAGLLADMLDLGLLEGQSSSLVQISLGDLDAEAGVSALIMALEAKQNATGETIAQLEGQVQSLQAEVSSSQQELDQLLRDQEVAQDTYLAVSNKVQAVKIQEQGDVGDVARLVSRAAVPQRPTGPRRLFNTAIAGVLGVMVAVLAVFVVEYWREDPLAAGPASAPPNDEPRQGVGRAV